MEDAFLWHTSIKEVHRLAVQYDIMAIFCVPTIFDTSDVNSARSSTAFVNAILDWNRLQDEDFYRWQEFLHLYGSEVDIESDQWMEEFLRKSMETAFKNEVLSDFDKLPKERRGAVS